MVKNIFRNTTIIVILLFSSGCATLYNPATGKKEFIFISSATEVAIGQGLITEITKEHPVSNDKDLLNRVGSVGARISDVSDRKDIEYKFSVLEDKELNAMALPGGFIYVNNGMMKALNNDELAYVVGHEVGHVAARHIAKHLQVNMAYQLLLAVAFSSLNKKEDKKSENIIMGVNLVFNLIALGYSRQDEYEADRLAAKYSFKSGYNPYAALSCLEKLKKLEGPNWKLLEYFKSHPFTDERINALKAFIPQLAKENK